MFVTSSKHSFPIDSFKEDYLLEEDEVTVSITLSFFESNLSSVGLIVDDVIDEFAETPPHSLNFEVINERSFKYKNMSVVQTWQTSVGDTTILHIKIVGRSGEGCVE